MVVREAEQTAQPHSRRRRRGERATSISGGGTLAHPAAAIARPLRRLYGLPAPSPPRFAPACASDPHHENECEEGRGRAVRAAAASLMETVVMHAVVPSTCVMVVVVVYEHAIARHSQRSGPPAAAAVLAPLARASEHARQHGRAGVASAQLRRSCASARAARCASTRQDLKRHLKQQIKAITKSSAYSTMSCKVEPLLKRDSETSIL